MKNIIKVSSSIQGLNLKGLKTLLTSKKETKVTNHSRNESLRSSTKQGEYHLVGGTGQTESPPSQEGLMSTNKLKGKKSEQRKWENQLKIRNLKNFKSKNKSRCCLKIYHHN